MLRAIFAAMAELVAIAFFAFTVVSVAAVIWVGHTEPLSTFLPWLRG